MQERESGRRECGCTRHSRLLLTIHIETVLVQDVAAQLGNAMGQAAQLPVQLLSIQPRACGIRVLGAGGIHSCCCSMPLRPVRASEGDENK